jgi:hypothetical protein
MPPIESSFTGGLNTSADYLSMPVGQCLTFSNMVLNYGILSPRRMHFVLNNASIDALPKTTVMSWTDSRAGFTLGSYMYVIGQHATTAKIYRSHSFFQDTWLTTTFAFDDVSGAINPGILPCSYDSLNSILVFTSQSTTAPFKFTANNVNAAALGGTPPTLQSSVKVVNNYMFLSGATTNVSRVYWSVLVDPETWPAANYLDFKQGSGESVVGLGSIGTDLFIFKGKGIGKLSTTGMATGPGPFTVMWDNVGLFGPHCVDNLPDGRLVFLSSDLEVYITDGYTLQRVARLPPPLPNVYPTLLTAATIGAPTTWLKYYPRRNEIIISSPYASVVLAYDVEQKYWRKITGLTLWGLGVLYQPPGASGATAGFYLIGSETNGNAIIADNYSATTTLTDENSAAIVAEASTSILFPQNFSESNMYGVSVLGTPSGAGAKLYVGYDNTYAAAAYAIDTTTKNRFDFTNVSSAHTNFKRPSTMQLKITSSLPVDKFYKVYVDSELED